MQISPAATNSPSSSKEVDVVLSYISANNRCDITAVLAHLDDDIRVIGPSGEIWASSKSEIEKFYVKDFSRAEIAGLHPFIETIEIGLVDQHAEEGIGKVRCKLHNLVTRQVVEVTYMLRLEDLKMVRHVLHRINGLEDGN